MSSKDSNKTFEKLKQFFRMNKGSSGAAALRVKEDYVLNYDQVREISSATSLNLRVKAIKELAEVARAHRLEENAVETLWTIVEDLFSSEVSRENRHVVFYFIKCIIVGQYETLGVMRKHIFNFIKSHNIVEDLSCRLELLESLIDHGRDIVLLEEEICPWLMFWGASELVPAGFTLQWLQISINVIKFNATYLDDEVINTVVQSSFFICSRSPVEKIVLECIQLLDTIICYSNLPPPSLPIFIATLCHSANSEKYCEQCWNTMRKLLGTHMGYSAVYLICQLLHKNTSKHNVGLVRGGVFYLNNALWSNKQITTLKISLLSVLPSIYFALSCDHPVVVLEVVLGMELLVMKQGADLLNVVWEKVLKILKSAAEFINRNGVTEMAVIVDHLNETLTKIEKLVATNHYSGSLEGLYDVIEVASLFRPPTSVFTLMAYRSEFLVTTQYQWIDNLKMFLNHFYTKENRTVIRIHTVTRTMKEVYLQNSALYEYELMNVILDVFNGVAKDKDPIVREAVCRLLINICKECDSEYHMKLLQILEEVLLRPYKEPASLYSESQTLQKNDTIDLQITVEGLSKLFVKFLYKHPSNSAESILKILITHLKCHYDQPLILDDIYLIRKEIFKLLVKLRADSRYRLGIQGVNEYSPYFHVERNNNSFGTVPYSPNSLIEGAKLKENVLVPLNNISLEAACKILIVALKAEFDWRVSSFILKEIPQVFKNRALLLSGSREFDAGQELVSTICDLTEKNVHHIKNCPSIWSKTDFLLALYPALAAFVSYHRYLELPLQQKLIKSIQIGLSNRCVQPVITTLTTCVLEMRDVMTKLLPNVLLNMSKLSTTPQSAIPVLEFLSMLSRLPRVFYNFVADQYMSVFAIALPYTNPFKYNHYTVSLAHRVIAIWFLKCRTSFRRNFVEFIKKGLNQNTTGPFELLVISKSDIRNEDSSSRQRSASLNEGSQNRGRTIPPVRSPLNDLKLPIDNSLLGFHKELTETCMDLLARYAFATCSALPKRLPTADFLLEEGQSATWLLGTKLITISTSGCTQKPVQNGLCSKCYKSCRLNTDQIRMSPKPGEKSKLSVSRSQSSETSDQTDVNTSVKGSVAVDDSKTLGPFNTNYSFDYPPRNDSVVNSEGLEKILSCSCWCQSWAEICVRCPTGVMSWMIRVQNDRFCQDINSDLSMFDISTLFHPTLGLKVSSEAMDKVCQNVEEEKHVVEKCIANNEIIKAEVIEKSQSRDPSEPVGIPGSPLKLTPSRQNSQDSCEVEDEYFDVEDIENGECRSRNPVRRSNSSPEMSSSWKNPLMKEMQSFENDNIDKDMDDIGKHLEMFNAPTDGKKTKQNYSKDSRYGSKANCEAIPEEICGTGLTPPSTFTKVPVCQPKPLTLSLNMDAVENKIDSLTFEKKINDKERPKLSIKSSSKFNSFNESDSSTKSSAESVDIKQSTEFPLGGHYVEDKSRSLTSTPSYLSTKPPLSPPINYGSQTLEKSENDTETPFRSRLHTLAVMTSKKPGSSVTSTYGRSYQEPMRSGISPSFVFLQLYHSTHFNNLEHYAKPILLPQQHPMISRAIQNLDWIPPYEVHKIGVIYVGLGQANSEIDILRNQHGSLRYTEFLKGLGILTKLSDASSQNVFVGGLECGHDGKFTYVWQDDIMQVIFHIATLMPTTESDAKCNNKKKNIGNDYVTIVYNESGQEYDMQTVKGQFNYGCVIVEPLEHGVNQIIVKVRDELRDHVGHQEPKIVSDKNASMLTRQLAIHTDLASQILASLSKENNVPYASNWLERLRQIRRIEKKVKHLDNGNGPPNNSGEQMSSRPSGSSNASTSSSRFRSAASSDFTEYT